MIMKRCFATSCLLLALGTLTHGQIVVSFSVDLSPSTNTFANAPASTLELNFNIDETGSISVDAVALDALGNSTSPGRWNQIDNLNAGTTSSSALFNTSFKLTLAGSGGPILAYPSDAGKSVLATAESNSTALENGEFVRFTVSGTATAVQGFSLDLTSFSYDNRLGNGQSSFGVEDTSGTFIEQLIPNTSLSGTISGAGISIAGGEAITFRTIAGNAGGAGLQGFEFSVSVVAVPEPATVAIYAGVAAIGLAIWRRRRAA